MALHVALLEPVTPPVVGALARQCAIVDASLHLVGPLPFEAGDDGLRKAGPDDWATLDWWVHPGWRDFRDAMSRDRCLYFAVDGERDPAEAPYRPNSVLVIGDEAGALPDRIREKYPQRVFRLPMPPRKRKVDIALSAELLLKTAAERLAAAREPAAPTTPSTPMRYGRGRARR